MAGTGAPFHLKRSSVQSALNNIPGYLSKHKALVEGTVVAGRRGDHPGGA